MFVTPVYDQNGLLKNISVYGHDVTDLKLAQEALSEANAGLEMKIAERTQKLTEYANNLARAEKIAKIGSWTLLLDTEQIIPSDGANDIYGVKDETIPVAVVQKFPLPEYREMMDKALTDLIAKDLLYDIEFKIRRQNDGRYLVS